jgi:transposase
MAKGRGGRPSKLTPEVKKRLLDAIRAGNYFEPACVYAGITYRTFRNWMERGEEAKSGEYFQFFHEVTRAEAEAEARMVAQWQAQVPNDWRAAKDFLARRYPDRWANRDKHELMGDGGGPIEVDFDPREELLRRIDRIAARSSESAGDPES